MRQFQAVIFDMDGVIVDSEARHERAFLDLVREIGYGDKLAMRFSDYIGRSDQVLWTDFVARHKPPQTVKELLIMKRDRMVELIRREQPLFDGLPALVEKLAARYLLGVASGSDRTVVGEVLEIERLGRFFGAVVTDSDIPRGKPAPDIFLRAAELLKSGWKNNLRLHLSRAQGAELREWLHGFLIFHLGRLPRGRAAAVAADG